MPQPTYWVMGRVAGVISLPKDKKSRPSLERSSFLEVYILKRANLKGKIKIVKINSYNSNTLFGDLYLNENLNEFAA